MDPQQQQMMMMQQQQQQPGMMQMQPGMQQQPMMMQQQPDMMNQQMQMMQQQNMQMQMQMQQLQQENSKKKWQTLDQRLMEYEFGVLIKQQFDLLEMLTGCERENKYDVFRRDKAGKKKGSKIFKFKEKSSCYDRCMVGECKPFHLKCASYQDGHDERQVMRCEKDCKCQYYCCNRVEMKCYYSESRGETEDDGEKVEAYIGKCYDPWDCCNFVFELYSDNGACMYTVKGSCCQLYFWLNCPCESCQRVEYNINQGTSSNVVGQLLRKGKDCCSNALMGDEADIFTTDFPSDSTWQARALLMSLCVFIDYVMFEEKNEKR